jgi:tetratricopeptide (TPR) repeat protein
MAWILDRLLAVVVPRRRRAVAPVVRRRTACSPPSPAAVRALAAALGRAMELGLWEHAERLAKAALRLPERSPRLIERLARLRLLQGRPEAALAIADENPECASLRLLRAVCLIQLGRTAEAHSDLHRWSRKATAPLTARRLLAMLEWNCGDLNAARTALAQNLHHLEDARTVEACVLLALAERRPEEAARWADRLRADAAFAGSGFEETLLESVGLFRSAHEAEAELHPRLIATLANELAANESVIPALAEAQRIEPNPQAARLLSAAIARALPDLANASAASGAMANLALVLEDAPAAVQWAKRGLEHNPMSAALAMLLQMAEQMAAAHGASVTEKAA